MGTAFAHIKLFGKLLIRIARDSLQQRWPLISVITLLNALSAISKLLVVVIIALSVKALGSDNGFNLLGFHIEKSIRSISILGGLIGLVALIGAVCAYYSAFYSRVLGRWANHKAMNEIQQIISLSPQKAQRAKFVVPPNLNILLTQLPLHTGLAYETVAMILNPALLLLFSMAALFYQSAMFANIILLGCVLVAPALLKTSINTQRNAKTFYSEKAIGMGSDVNSIITKLNYQHGIIPKSNNQQNNTLSNLFFDSYDKNLLANHKTALVVSLLDAVLRPAIFITICSMVFLGKFSVEVAITILGSLAYFLSSSRTVLSLCTNLLRFQPQVKQYYDFVDVFNNSSSNANSIADRPQQYTFKSTVTVALLPKPVSTLSMGYYLPTLLSQKDKNNIGTDNVFFVFSSFRFQIGATVIEQLCGGEPPTTELKQKVLKICTCIDAADSFFALNKGLDTKLSEPTWNQLDSAARAAIRIVPLILKPAGSIVLLDISVIKSIAPNTLENIISSFSHCDLYITTTGLSTDIVSADRYCVVNEAGEINFGNKKWFEEQLSHHNNDPSETLNSLNTTMLL